PTPSALGNWIAGVFWLRLTAGMTGGSPSTSTQNHSGSDEPAADVDAGSAGEPSSACSGTGPGPGGQLPGNVPSFGASGSDESTEPGGVGSAGAEDEKAAASSASHCGGA